MGDDSVRPAPRIRVHDVLDGNVENGTHAVLVGSFGEVIVKRHEQSGYWAR